MRKLRENELLWFLSLCSEGMAIKEIVGEHEILEKAELQPLIKKHVVWPRATVFRHLKNLIADNKVIKQRDSRNEGCRGRRTLRYQVNPSRKFVLEWPLGMSYQRYNTTVLRQSPEQKQFSEEYSKYLSRK